MECFKVLPGDMDDVVEASQVVVCCLLSEAQAHNHTLVHSKVDRSSHESAYSTRVVNPPPVNIELVLVCAFRQLHYC